MPEAFSIDMASLASLEPKSWPSELISQKHLIYSSPAALAFNSPGAEGFGVKRAALTLPGSVMLLFSPGCCGRNTSALGGPESRYGQRTFYLLLDETDIVTGRYQTKIVDACQEIAQSLTPAPQVIVLLSTCVDALLATDMERLVRLAQKRTQIPCLSATMYALTREGHIPPMVGVRKSLYSLLQKAPKDPSRVNLLGFFTPLADDCELYSLLGNAGFSHVQELARMADMAEYQNLARANFNLVLHPESRLAAKFFEERLEIPSIELTQSFELEKIHKQYAILSRLLPTPLDDHQAFEAALSKRKEQAALLHDLSFAIGETSNAEPFGLALALLRMGCRVAEIFAEPAAEKLALIKAIAAISPKTRLASNLSPSMLMYQPKPGEVDVAIGSDACYYHPEAAQVPFLDEAKPFGYQGFCALLNAIDEACHKAQSKAQNTGVHVCAAC
ncbi:MAG: nitrogenase component 1 [Desulfovibrio sp.]|nr:nitrogenase component 1 [Desulfovibrio sp.]